MTKSTTRRFLCCLLALCCLLGSLTASRWRRGQAILTARP